MLDTLPETSRHTPTRSTAIAAAVIGSVLVLAALLIIWVARLSLQRPAYVSELGADGEPTAGWFEIALLLIVVGGSGIAWSGRAIRSRAWLIGRWAPAVSLWVGCAFFLVASQVPCTTGCPLPVGESFSWQDLIHIVSAVLAFAAACIAMLQTSFSDGSRLLARLSLLMAIGVAVIAGAGGILSLLRFGTTVGSVLELVATTLAMGWLIVFGWTVAHSALTTGRA
jgi:Protein of unknown function (DUF998)